MSKPQYSGKQAYAVVLIEFFSQLSQVWRIPLNQIFVWHPIFTRKYLALSRAEKLTYFTGIGMLFFLLYHLILSRVYAYCQ